MLGSAVLHTAILVGWERCIWGCQWIWEPFQGNLGGREFVLKFAISGEWFKVLLL